jgi:adenosylcobinamide kinase / adenosylcobinamide-phosphate guanylyltransferase
MTAGSRVLVLGGARSGKSTYAERLLADEPAVDYVATSGQRPDDPEWLQRVAEHQARRPQRWRTLETTDLEAVLTTPGPPVLIDCLTLWLTAVMDETGAWDDAKWREGGRDAVHARIDALVDAWHETPRYVVAVSNEVGSGVVPSYPSGIRFRDELGRLNMRLAEIADRVMLLVAGQPLDLSAERTR